MQKRKWLLLNAIVADLINMFVVLQNVLKFKQLIKNCQQAVHCGMSRIESDYMKISIIVYSKVVC